MAQKKYKILFIAGLMISILLISGCTTREETFEPKEEDKAMISSTATDWYINEYNYNELHIEAAVLNYGYKEAKNVELYCKIYIDSTEPIITARDNIGNIASTSLKYVEIISEIDYSILDKYGDNYTAYIYCVPVSCDNCILLEERLPEYQEYY